MAVQDGFIESFNGRLRDECLNEMLFSSLAHARHVLAAWKDDYNHAQPHLTPAEATTKAGTQAGLGHAPAPLAITARFGHQNHKGLHPLPEGTPVSGH